MSSILITGCNRGLGLGLIKCFLKLSPSPQHIIATCRDPQQAEELSSLAQQHSNLHLLQIDLKDVDRYEQFAAEVNSIVGDNGLNVLFNNAGVSPKSTRLNFVKSDDLVDTFLTNTVAPIMLTKTLTPLLKKAAEANASTPMGPRKACIINMSSILGSIEANTDGGLYAYRTSKSALNAATKSMSIDLRSNQIMAVAMHPGWVRTDMGGSKAPLAVEQSCEQMVQTVLSLGEKHNGGFLQYDGKELPW
ncbi:C-factor [Toxorhynchites rutilus septentrionalis]|uniref:C-factor n=1 Tax=Toxorhynchites rutilus septentrionalis TaxID=329112 RepID=UPI00247989A6|nr:C-factor [Toxorhynchites rutilus septentrionalis]XP_055632545.1 C-factor [Toxorhynchites rutilus septentrionalis]